jgi:hypothetical protein
LLSKLYHLKKIKESFNDKLILIKTDTLKNLFSEKTRIPEITMSIKETAYNILAGPNMIVTAQASDYMIYSYKRKKIKGEPHNRMQPLDHKYYIWNDFQ